MRKAACVCVCHTRVPPPRERAALGLGGAWGRGGGRGGVTLEESSCTHLCPLVHTRVSSPAPLPLMHACVPSAHPMFARLPAFPPPALARPYLCTISPCTQVCTAPRPFHPSPCTRVCRLPLPPPIGPCVLLCVSAPFLHTHVRVPSALAQLVPFSPCTPVCTPGPPIFACLRVLAPPVLTLSCSPHSLHTRVPRAAPYLHTQHLHGCGCPPHACVTWGGWGEGDHEGTPCDPR